MTVISGKHGAVDGVGTVRTWSISSSADLQAVVASNTKGGTSRSEGNIDWDGQYTAYGDDPTHYPGEGFTFTGCLDTTVNKGFSGVAIVDGVEIVVDIAAAAVIAHVVNFSANGVLDPVDTTGVEDVTIPNPPSSKGCKVQIGTFLSTAVFADFVDVTRFAISITTDNKPYVTSSTAGQTQRKEGNVDARVSIDWALDEDGMAGLPVANDINEVKLYVNATEFFHFKWLMWSEPDNVEVSRESADIINGTLTGELKVAAAPETTPAIGFIKKPGGASYFS